MKRLSISLFALPLVAMFAFSLCACISPAGCTASEWIAAGMVMPGVVIVLFMPMPLLLAGALWLLFTLTPYSGMALSAFRCNRRLGLCVAVRLADSRGVPIGLELSSSAIEWSLGAGSNNNGSDGHHLVSSDLAQSRICTERLTASFLHQSLA